MKIAIMGDVHANPHALETAIEDAKSFGCEKFWFLGDVTGYGYDVKESVRLVREEFDLALMGNHDAVCSDRFSMGHGNHNYDIDRAEARQLSEKDLEWLRGLPLTYTDGDVACVHGDFTNPREFRYVMSEDDVFENMWRAERLLFCAHLHLSGLWKIEGDATITRLDHLASSAITEPELYTYKLRGDCRYLCNCGSVGYPRLERATVYAMLDKDADTVSIRRLPFDFQAYTQDLVRAGLEIPAWMK